MKTINFILLEIKENSLFFKNEKARTQSVKDRSSPNKLKLWSRFR